MKRIRSWVIIISATIVACAAVGFLFIGTWWNTIILLCVLLLFYAMKNDSKV